MIPDFNYGLSFLSSRDLAQPTRDRVDQLSQEVASGLYADAGRALRSDFSETSKLTHQLNTFASHSEALQRGITWGNALQAAVGRFETSLGRLADGMTVGLSGPDVGGVNRLSETARGVVEDLASAINTGVGARGLFVNGAAREAIADVDALLADIGSLAAASPNYQSYATAVDAFFDTGGDYDTVHAAALDQDRASFALGEGQRVSFDVDNRDAALVSGLKQAALIFGLSSASFANTRATRNEIATDLQVRQSDSLANLAGLSGRIGSIEARISEKFDILEANRLSAEQRLGDLLHADPFEASIRLQDEMSRLETIYAITARQSRLRLTDYLR